MLMEEKKYFSPDDDKKSFHGFTDEEIPLSEKLNRFGKCLDTSIFVVIYISVSSNLPLPFYDTDLQNDTNDIMLDRLNNNSIPTQSASL